MVKRPCYNGYSYPVGIMSKLFYQDKPVIGLDISNTGIKVMSVDPKKWLVHGYGSIDLEPLKVKDAMENAESTYLTDSIKVLLAEKVIGDLSSKRVAIAVPTARSYSRTFTLPSSAEKSLHDAVILEADQYIPIPSANLYIDYQIIERGKKEITVLIKVADFYEEEVDLAIASISSIIEPTMIVIMGSMVGLIAASVMTPIAQLSQNVK